MSCDCGGPVKTSLWTPLALPSNATGEIAPGENMDCYMRRATDEGPKDDARQAPKDRIVNNSIVADGTLKVDEQFTVTGPRVATSWTMTPTIPGLTFNTSTGKLAGTVDTSQESATFKITITASDGTGQIDSREYTFAPTKPQKDDSIKLIIPYIPQSGEAIIKSPFGPRIHPITKVNKPHKGQDWVAKTPSAKGKGTIVAAADGEVVTVGWDPSGYGNFIKVNHKGASGKLLCLTLYGHTSVVLVKQGQQVSQGQKIALEGSTGASTGPHLHFEVRLGGTTPVDPMPYFDGTITVTPPSNDDGTQPPDQAVKATGAAVTGNEVNARAGCNCPPVTTAPPPPPSGADPKGYDSPIKSDCVPPPDQRLTKDQVIAKIESTLSADNRLDANDRKFLQFVALIESGNDTYAKNPTSSATGLYQMLDRTAETYYAKIGQPATCPNRIDPVLATKAMIEFYISELKRYMVEYIKTGKLAGKHVAQTSFSERYGTFSRSAFMYGLIHHDGVGNAVAGIDKGGVSYFTGKARQYGYDQGISVAQAQSSGVYA